jgi:ABC-2 type transport system permease protein
VSVASYARVVRAGMMKNYRLTVTYPTQLVNRILGPILWVGISLFSYAAIAGPDQLRQAFEREGAGPDVVGFLILGQTIFSLFQSLNWRGGMAINRERWQGTLEIVLLAPTSRVAFVLGESVYGILDGGWSVFLALVVTALAFGAHFQLADPILAAVAIALTLAAMLALSLFFSAFYVLTRSAGPLSWAVQTPIRFFTGTSFPISALPAVGQAVSFAIPVTYGMIAVRASFDGTATWSNVGGTLAALAAFTALFWALGVVLIRRMERIAKQRGTLHTY